MSHQGELVPLPHSDAELAAPLRPAFDLEAIIRDAVNKGPDGVAALERLVVLKRDLDRDAALSALNAALSDFRRMCPVIAKNRTGETVSQTGARFSYTFADLPALATSVNPILASLGLSYSWTSDPASDLSKVRERCIVRHALGATVEADSPWIPIETKAGMSPQQKVASAQTFARRLALVSALGITSADRDDDGSEDADGGDRVTSDQVTQIEGWLSETGDADGWRPAMLRAFGAATVADLPADRFDEIVAKLKAKRGQPYIAPPAARKGGAA